MTEDPNHVDFYLRNEEPQRSCLLALRDLIFKANSEIVETVKYGMPCFLLKKKIFCYLWTDRKTGAPYILFADGNRIEHDLLQVGTRSRMKILPVDPSKDLPADAISWILRMALTVSAGGATNTTKIR
jgi:hypothetical protein